MRNQQGVSRIALVLVGVAVIATLIGVYFIALRKPAPGLFVGAYAEYEVSGAVPLIGDLTGTFRAEIVGETAETYTVSYTATGTVGAFIEPSTETISKGEVIGHRKRELELVLVGYETMPTILGKRDVVHYRAENYNPELDTTDIYDFYVDKEWKIPYLMNVKDFGALTCRLSRTNIY